MVVAAAVRDYMDKSHRPNIGTGTHTHTHALIHTLNTQILESLGYLILITMTTLGLSDPQR